VCVLLNKRADADGGVAEREPARWRSGERHLVEFQGGVQALSRRPPAAKPNRQIGRATFYIPFPSLASKIR